LVLVETTPRMVRAVWALEPVSALASARQAQALRERVWRDARSSCRWAQIPPKAPMVPPAQRVEAARRHVAVVAQPKAGAREQRLQREWTPDSAEQVEQ
jgi:hypothetical protein